VPSLYYGDEAGVEGYHDPFCRLPYPWGHENQVLLEHYRKLGKIREQNRELFATGEFKLLDATDGVVSYMRYNADDSICVIANATKSRVDYELEGDWKNLLNGRTYTDAVPPMSCVILKRK
jgi:4-alpha-glucanotransferase